MGRPSVEYTLDLIDHALWDEEAGPDAMSVRWDGAGPAEEWAPVNAVVTYWYADDLSGRLLHADEAVAITVSATGAVAMANTWGPQVPAGTVSQLDNHIMRAYMLYYRAGGRDQWPTSST